MPINMNRYLPLDINRYLPIDMKKCLNQIALQQKYLSYTPIIIFYQTNQSKDIMSIKDNTLIKNISKILSESDYQKSQSLFKQLVQIIAQKVLPQPQNHTSIVQKQHKSYLLTNQTRKEKKSRISKKKKVKKVNQKSLTLPNLKLCAKNYISNRNKKIHKKFQKLNKFQQMKLDFSNRKWNDNFLKFNSAQQKPKNQSSQTQQNEQKISQKILSKSRHKQIRQNKIKKALTTSKEDKTSIKLKNLQKDFQERLKLKENTLNLEQFLCPICIQLLIDPVSTICGHSFCLHCLEDSLLPKKTCPVCRTDIRSMDLAPCNNLSELIKVRLKYEDILPQTEQIYDLNKKKNGQWRQRRFIKVQEIQQGQLIDVRDVYGIWSVARVMKIYFKNEKMSSILVSYLDKDKVLNEVIEIGSYRLAKLGFYSSRGIEQGQIIRSNNQIGTGTNRINNQFLMVFPQRNQRNNAQIEAIIRTMEQMNHRVNHGGQNIGPFRISDMLQSNMNVMDLFEDEAIQEGQMNEQEIQRLEYIEQQEQIQQNNNQPNYDQQQLEQTILQHPNLQFNDVDNNQQPVQQSNQQHQEHQEQQ